MKNRSLYNKGFTLVELLTTILLLTVLMGFAVKTFGTVIRDTRFKGEVTRIDSLIRKTMSECMARGTAGRIAVGAMTADDPDPSAGDGTLRGFYLDENDELVELFRMELEDTEFTRSFDDATPWLGNTDVDKPSSFTDNLVLITATGMVESSGTIYLKYVDHDEEAAIEILANGTVDTFYNMGVNSEGEVVWVR